MKTLVNGGDIREAFLENDCKQNTKKLKNVMLYTRTTDWYNFGVDTLKTWGAETVTMTEWIKR